MKHTKLPRHDFRSYYAVLGPDVRSIRISLEGKSCVLVDTPGFDDTYRSDVEILELISEWLRRRCVQCQQYNLLSKF